ncbi:MAG: hypothetical protein J7576_13295 [Siphonobacter aquaeclarae]|nr:hypothetical protein [Siphonobacter aquaeclarae]
MFKSLLSSLLLFLVSGLAFSSWGQDVSWPKEGAIFQRDAAVSGKASIKFVVSSASAISNFKVRFKRYPLSGNLSGVSYIDPRPAPENKQTDGYLNGVSVVTESSCRVSFTISVTQGMYYMETSIGANRQFGVGEVLAIAGQSNAAGYALGGAPSIGNSNPTFVKFFNEKTTANNLEGFDGNDPGKASGTSKDFIWFWGRLGASLVTNLQVPVAFYQAAWCGSNIDEWEKSSKGENTKYVFGYPYKNLQTVVSSIRYRYGLRGVLWQQGEQDDSTNTQNYDAKLAWLVDKSRVDAGGNNSLAWVIARASMRGGAIDKQIVAAQERVIGHTNAAGTILKSFGDYSASQRTGSDNVSYRFRGPKTDDILTSARRSDGTHLNDILSGSNCGQCQGADKWYEALTTAWSGNGQNFFGNSIPLNNNQTVDVAGSTCDGPCTISSPVVIGSWSGYTVQLMKFDGNVALVTVVPGGPGGANKYFARGKNFWTSVSRNANTDQYYNCITVGETGYGGLVLPFDVNYTPTGYSKGTEADGAVYYYQGGCTPPATPTLSANPTTIQSGQTSTLSASGCNGTVTFYNSSTNAVVSSSVTAGSYYARCSSGNCFSGNSNVVTVTTGNDPCALTTPVSIGTWSGYAVQLRKFDNNKVLVTVVPGGPGGANKYFARGKNYWNSVSRYANTDQYYTCINVGDTGFDGLVLPFPTTYTPAGYSKGTEPDGAVYYYIPGGGRQASAEETPADDLTISANPSDGNFRVTAFVAGGRKAALQVSDLKGRVWLQKSFTGEGRQTHEVRLAGKVSGVLVVTLETDLGKHSKRVLIQ